MALGLLSRPRALCHKHKQAAQRLRITSACLIYRNYGRNLRCLATRTELVALGLPAGDLARVEAAIAKTQATGISESIRLLINYTGSASAASKLVGQHPNLLCCQLPSWIEFLSSFLNKAQLQHVLCQAPEALIEGDLVRAGGSLLAFRRIGLDDSAAAQWITYYPQLLCKEEQEIRSLLSLLGRYGTGVDALSDVRQV